MRSVPPSVSLAPDLPFKFVGGDLSLDFVNTVDWTPRGPAEDRLTDYARLLDWALATGALSATAAARLRTRAARSPGDAQAAIDEARRTRWVLRRLFETIVEGRRSPDALAQFNALLLDMYQHLVLTWPRGVSPRGDDGTTSPLSWEWHGLDERPAAVLWPVVRAAAELLASDEVAKLRICGGPDCGWMYVDRSRNGFRRWCEMSVCGTREKSRRRAAARRRDRPRRTRARS